jgi:ADP-heptose:LPS heptosyltransferase
MARADGVDFGAPLLAVGPGSKMPAKIWPAARFAELGIRIKKVFPRLQLIVLGGKESVAVGRELCAAWGANAYSFAGQLSLYGSAAILEHCIAYVGNDTGTMHLAAMMGTPCVAIFSARDSPGRWDPHGKGHLVLRHEVECAGCLLDVCAEFDNQCLKLVPVDEVLAAVRGIVTKATSTGIPAVSAANLSTDRRSVAH